MNNPDKYVDLHLHSNLSDGSDPPAQVVARAKALGFAAIALTDHDSIAGLAEAARAASQVEIGFLNGIEISGAYGSTEIHVVGLGMSNFEPMETALLKLRAARENRIDSILERLNHSGVAVTREHVDAQAKDASAIGRMHVARAMVGRGTAKTTQEAFDRFLGRGKKAFVPKKTITCSKAIGIIHEAGGLAFLGHPGIGATVKNILSRLLLLPFDGLEAYHTRHSPGETTMFLQIAHDRHLLVSGGSDCHGSATGPSDMGKVRLPYRYFEAILEKLK